MSTPINPITSVEAAPRAVQERASSASNRSAPSKAPVIKPPTDTLQLSTASRVASLAAIGRSVDQIAAILGISASEVDTDLGVTTGVSNSTYAVAAAASAKQ